MTKLKFAMLLGVFMKMGLLHARDASAEESSVYQVFRAVDLGETDRPPPKDIYVNIGNQHGIKKGSMLDVYRKVSSFDNLTERLVGDHLIPVGRLKVIHTDDKTAIARLDKFVSVDQEPGLMPQAIMVGDVVRSSKGE